MPKFFLPHKKLILTSILILLISSLGIFILGTEEAQAAWAVDSFVRGILIGIGYILAGVLWLGGQILNAAAGLVSGLLAYTEFTKAPIVIAGWKIVRDLTNMFFVLILLIIAFATILRIETYGMKTLLPKLIIAALLINFSLVLAGPIIDFSQTLTQFFIDGSGGTDFTAKIATALGLSKIASYKERTCTGGWTNCTDGMSLCVQACGIRGGSTGSECLELCQPTHCQCSAWGETTEDYQWPGGVMDVVNTLMGLSMAIVFSVVAIFAFLAFAFFLLVRILTLWFLLILAPIVWLFWVLPATRKHFIQWWSAFIKWSFFAPAYMFFVYLALKTFPAFLTMSVIDASDTGVKVDTLLPKLLSFKYLFQFILVLGILLGGLIVAQKMGVYGAQGAMGIAKFFGKGATGFANRWLASGARIAGAGALTKGLRKIGWEKGARGLERIGRAKEKVVPYVSPGVWKRGWMARREEAEREAFRLPAPALQDKLTRIFSLGKEKSDYLERAKRRERIEERQKIVTTNSEELTGGFKRASEAGLGSKAAAYAQASAEQGDLNDLMREFGYKFNAEGISKFTEEQFKPLLGEQDAYRLGHDLNKALEQVGQWPGRIFKSIYDGKTGKTSYQNLIKEFGPAKGSKMALEEAYKPWSRLEGQARARFTHRLGIISESKDVPPKDLGIKGHEMWIRGLMPRHAERMQDEVIGTLMFRHADETEKINPALYEKLSGILSERTPEQLEEMKKMIKEVAPGIETSSWSPKETKPSRTVPPTKESFEEARAKSPPGAFG